MSHVIPADSRAPRHYKVITTFTDGTKERFEVRAPTAWEARSRVLILLRNSKEERKPQHWSFLSKELAPNFYASF